MVVEIKRNEVKKGEKEPPTTNSHGHRRATTPSIPNRTKRIGNQRLLQHVGGQRILAKKGKHCHLNKSWSSQKNDESTNEQSHIWKLIIKKLASNINRLHFKCQLQTKTIDESSCSN